MFGRQRLMTRSRTGLRMMRLSRTASSSTRVSAAIVFLSVECEGVVSQMSLVRSMSPIVISRK